MFADVQLVGGQRHRGAELDAHVEGDVAGALLDVEAGSVRALTPASISVCALELEDGLATCSGRVAQGEPLDDAR